MNNKTEKKRREYRYTIRLTEEENERLITDMKSNDYMSFARYIRDRLFKRRIEIKKTKVTDRSIRNQINYLTLQVKKIGVNYNSLVKRYMSLSQAVKPDGTPSFTHKSSDFFMNQLAGLTQEMKNKLDEVIETVKKLDIESPSEEGPQNTNQ